MICHSLSPGGTDDEAMAGGGYACSLLLSHPPAHGALGKQVQGHHEQQDYEQTDTHTHTLARCDVMEETMSLLFFIRKYCLGQHVGIMM